MNFYKHHIGDYAASTVHLSPLEDCFYRRMLDAYYLREKPLPVAEADVCRLVRAQSAPEKRAVQAVLVEFFDRREDGRHQKRCDEEVVAYQQQADTNRRIATEREARRAETNRSTNRATNRSTIGSPAYTDTGEPNHKPEPEPLKKEKDKKETPADAVAPPLKPAKRKTVTFDDFAADCRTSGIPAIPEDDPILAYAEKAGITAEMMRLAWGKFRERYSGTTKRYADWRAHFRNAVRDNWFRLWYVAEDGHVRLTTAGKITEKVAA